MLVAMGVDLNGDKALLAIDDASAESEESWAGVSESLRERGPKDVALLVADGAAGIWSAFSKAYPRAKQQRCWLHKMRNVLHKVPERIEAEVQGSLREIMNAEDRKLAESLAEKLAASLDRNYSKAAKCLRDDSERMLAYYAFPDEQWRHLRTTNIIEFELRSRPFAHQRLQTVTERNIGDVSGVRAPRSPQRSLAPVQRLSTPQRCSPATHRSKRKRAGYCKEESRVR